MCRYGSMITELMQHVSGTRDELAREQRIPLLFQVLGTYFAHPWRAYTR